MKSYTMFLDWKNQNSENDYTTQSLKYCTMLHFSGGFINFFPHEFSVKWDIKGSPGKSLEYWIKLTVV